MNGHRKFVFVCAGLAAWSGCAGDVLPPDGATVFTSPAETGNAFACASCHALAEPAADGLRRVAHPLDNVTRRPHYKNGQLQSLLAAVNTCRAEWMAATVWAEDDAAWAALFDWLDAQATVPRSEAIEFAIASADGITAPGDAGRGAEVYDLTCIACHGAGGVGTGLAPPLAGDLLEPQGGLDYIVRRVRTSGLSDSATYPGLTGGRMPFWAADRLSDAELADVAAYLLDNDATSSDTGTPGDVPGLSSPGACASTHPDVGKTAQLSQKFHQVGGDVTIENDCTIRIDQFTYDGAGIDVRLYGAQGADFANGFPIGPNLLRSGGYQGVTVYFVLPSGKTLDDLDSVSIWCVDAAVDFGSASFD